VPPFPIPGLSHVVEKTEERSLGRCRKQRLQETEALAPLS